MHLYSLSKNKNLSQSNNQLAQVMIDSHVKLTISLQFSYRCDRQKVEPRSFKNSGAILRTIFPNKAVATDIFVLTDNSKIVLNYVASCQESPVFSATGSFWYQGFKPEPFIDIRSLAAGSPARDLCRNKTKQKKKKSHSAWEKVIHANGSDEPMVTELLQPPESVRHNDTLGVVECLDLTSAVC